MDVETKENKAVQPADKDKNYEALMAELAQVMKTMENSESTLEEQLKGYERGMQLCSDLEALLKAAEERIMIINKAGQEERFE